MHSGLKLAAAAYLAAATTLLGFGSKPGSGPKLSAAMTVATWAGDIGCARLTTSCSFMGGEGMACERGNTNELQNNFKN
jgi:hypothetical protein